jgi:hypothetical protein
MSAATCTPAFNHDLMKCRPMYCMQVRYIAPWHLLLTLCYDNCLRAYDSITGELKHEWENENKCLFTGLEVDLEYAEV